MVEDPKNDQKHLMPFIIFQNQLELMGRVMTSSCKLSMAMLSATEKSKEQVSTVVPDQIKENPTMSTIIPSTDDMQSAAGAVATAMNAAAVRAIANVSRKKTDDDDNNAPTPAQPKRTYKPSISAAKNAKSARASTSK